MALKKTVHGEKLEQRTTFGGVHAKSRFKVRDVYCPRCGAKPHRKCQWNRTELEGEFCVWTVKWWGRTPREAEREAKRRNRHGYDHEERRARADQLTALAHQGGPRREQKAVTLPSVALPPQASCAPPRRRDSRDEPLYRLAVRDAIDNRWMLQRLDHLPLFAQSARLKSATSRCTV